MIFLDNICAIICQIIGKNFNCDKISEPNQGRHFLMLQFGDFLQYVSYIKKKERKEIPIANKQIIWGKGEN